MNANYTASATASIVTPAFTVPAGGATLDLSYYIDTEAPSGGADFGSIRLLDASDDSPLAGGEIAADLQGISVMWINGSFPLPAAANGLEVRSSSVSRVTPIPLPSLVSTLMMSS